MSELLLSGLLPGWVTGTFPTIRIVLVSLLVLSAIVMVICILASPAQVGRGSNAITGASESFYTKNKSSNNQGRIRNMVIICASLMAVCAILYFVTYVIYNPIV